MASTLVPPGPAAAAPGDGDGPALALAPGTTVGDGRYVVEDVLGWGGFGITYAAVDTRLQRPVAIKELFPDGARREGRDVVVTATAEASFARARERFLREATTLARFGHPGIVRIWGALEENGTAYLVLEQLQGRTLAEELHARRGPFTQAEALDVAAQVADALDVVHQAGVLHRDVSPANLVRSEDGRVVLIDFGLARPFALDRTTAMTRIVTPGYASPEQYEGLARFGPRSDVYALGATLYRLVTTRIPPGANVRSRHDTLVPAWRLNPSVSRPVSDALAAALALDPDLRPASVAALLERLGLAFDHVAAPPIPAPIGDVPTEVVDVRGPVDAEAVDLRPPTPALVGRSAGVPGDPPTVAGPAASVAAQGASARWPAGSASPAAASRRAAVPAPHAARAPVPAPAPPVWSPTGAPPPRRAWVTLPLGLAAVALASAQPVTMTMVLALVVAPALATVGDHLVRPHRSLAWAPAWWGRNVAVGLVRGFGAACILAVGLCLWYGTEAFTGLATAGPWVLRATGVGAGWVLASSIGRGGAGFRSHAALDHLAGRLLPRGRFTPAAGVLLVVCAVVVAAGAWFRPEAWPLGG